MSLEDLRVGMAGGELVPPSNAKFEVA